MAIPSFIKHTISSLLLSSFFVVNALANGLELSGQIGPTNLHVGNALFPVTAIETDTLNEVANPKVPEFSIGANYIFLLNHSLQTGCIAWFPKIKTGINLRYFIQEITGNVYQFQDPSMNNYNYELSLENTRLMLDVILTLFSIKEKTTVYVLGGIGNAWTKVGYQDTPITGVFSGVLNLRDRTNNGFSYETGVGALYPLDNNTDLFLEYRYAHFQKIRTASEGTLNGQPATITPARFPFFSQTLSLGINWKI